MPEGPGVLSRISRERKFHNELAKSAFSEPLNGHPAVRVFRRLTPDARSVDEKSLSLDMVALATRWFETVAYRPRFLLAVIASSVNLIYPSAGRYLKGYWQNSVIAYLTSYLD